MAFTTILTIYSGATAYNFNDQEVHGVNIITRQNVDIKYLQNGKPRVTLLGNEWNEIFVDIKPESQTVMTNVEALITINTPMGFKLMNLAGNTVQLFSVTIDPNFTTYFAEGFQEASKILRMHCIESSDDYLVAPIELYNDFIGV